jgi:hypothetical protein
MRSAGELRIPAHSEGRRDDRANQITVPHETSPAPQTGLGRWPECANCRHPSLRFPREGILCTASGRNLQVEFCYAAPNLVFR